MPLNYNRARRVTPNRKGSLGVAAHRQRDKGKDPLLIGIDLILFSVLSHRLFCLGSKLIATFSHPKNFQASWAAFFIIEVKLGSPELVTKTTGCPVKFKFLTTNEPYLV